jgi:hypothetical protein
MSVYSVPSGETLDTGKYNETVGEEGAVGQDVRGFITKLLASSSAADVIPLGEYYKVLQP